MPFWSRLINVFRNDRVNREIEEELQSHLDEALTEGRDPAEARRAFGSMLRQREESRDVRVVAWLDSLRADAVFGWRQLTKRKVTSAAAVLSLALAIGACTSAFRLVDALLLRPLPVAGAERLYSVAFEGIGADGKAFTYDSCSYPMYRQMRAEMAGQAELIAVSYADHVDLTYGSDQEMERAYSQNVSGGMFGAFGLQPAAGRLLTQNDDVTPGAHPVAVLSYDYWTRRFGRDPKAVGRKFRMGATLFEIAGVAGEGFTGTETGTVTDIFIPMMMRSARTLASANNFWFRTLVQLKPGIAPGPVRDRLAAIYYAGEEERLRGLPVLPKTQVARFLQQRFLLEPAAAGRSNLQRDYRRALSTLGVLVALVLLIACANVANLMSARAGARAREMALRVSIGAGRWRLVQLVLVESAWLALLASAAGGIFAWWSAPVIVGMINPPDNPARLVLPADWRVLGFGLAMAATVTFLFGLMPALRASGVKPASAMKGGDDPHMRRRVMHALIAVQVAFCFVVTFAAGLFVGTFDRMANQPLGFSAARIVNLESVTSTAQPAATWERVAEHLRDLPGVEKATLSLWPVMSGESTVSYISVDGAPPSEIFADILYVSPGWADTLRIPLLAGRDFRADDKTVSIAMVNEAFAKQFFKGENPVGKAFDKLDSTGGRVRFQVAGLVGDARSRDNVRLALRPTAYLPFPLSARGNFVVRTTAVNPLALASMLRREVPREWPECRVSNIRTQEEIDRAPMFRERLLALLALFFAAVALLLGGVGLYGVLDYSVLQRRREIGIRMAIGAPSGHIARTVAAEAFAMVSIGAAAGIACGMASVRYVSALLYGVKATDSIMLALPAFTILAAAALAAVPAILRAVRIDPMTSLRVE